MEEEEEEEEEEVVTKKKRSKKNRSGRKRRRIQLDEDDLDLITDNLGFGTRRNEDERPSKFRRLKRTSTLDDSPERDYYDYSPQRRRDRLTDYDDDLDDHGYADFPDEIEARQIMDTASAAKNSEAARLFGDDAIDEYIVDEDDVDMEQEGLEPISVKSFIEPSELARNFMTDKDLMIQKTDCPERIQIQGLSDKPPIEKELEEEAEWIAKILGTNHHNEDDIVFVDTIFEVLKAIRILFVEVPYIATYKKNICENYKELNIWQIVDLDEKWRTFYKQKQNFQEIINETESINNEIDYLKYLSETHNEEQLIDLQNHFNLYNSSSSTTRPNHQKRPIQRGIYYDCINEEIDKCAAKYGISAKQFGENFIQNYPTHSVHDHYETPEELALNFVTKKFSTTEMVLKASRHVLAIQIANDISVKQLIREKLRSNGVISTEPTPLGESEIDEQHLLHCVKRLKCKPISFMKTQQQLSHLIHGISSKLITVHLDLPENELQSLYKRMCDNFRSQSTNRYGTSWNKEREITLKMALYDKLLPMLRKEVLDHLFQNERELILHQCEEKLRQIACLGPHGGKPRGVVSVIWGPDSVKDPVIATNINREGKYEKHIRLNHMSYSNFSINPNNRDENIRVNQKNNDLQQLQTFIADSKPSVIVVGANCMHARELYKDIERILAEMRKDYRSVAAVVWGSTNVPNLCSITAEYEKEFPKMSKIHRTGIALARMLQDPLPQLCLLCNNQYAITGIPLHPLQCVVAKQILMKRLERVLIDYVNLVGVDVNRIIQCEYLMPCMKFICGLGPSKADYILGHLKTKRCIMSRKSISDYCPNVGEIVYRNMIGFLKVSDEHFPDGDYPEETNILDATRIHPDHYNYAIQIMGAVVKNCLPNEYEDDDYKIISTFEEIQLEEIHHELSVINFQKDRELSRIPLWLLNDIRTELIHRFKDSRIPYDNLSTDDLFTGLTGESDLTLQKGQLVTGTVTKITPDEVLLKLESGIQGKIDKDDISDEPVHRIGDRVAVRQAILCRVKEIDKDNFRVILTSRSSDLKNSDHAYTDQYLCRTPPPPIENHTSSSLKSSSMNRKSSKPRLIQRMITHPLFKNISYQQAEQLLEDSETGELIFRPSSKGTDHLNLTYKFHDDIVHLDIKEEDKLPDNPLVIGRRLIIRDQVFHDLNHIEAQYLEPIVVLIQDMKAFRRFSADPEQVIINDLNATKRQNPTSIPYKIGVSNEYKGRYVLYYIPNKSVRREYISCTPTGFQFRREKFDTPGALVDWFKKNWKGSRSRASSSSNSSNIHHSSSSSSHRSSTYQQPSATPVDSWTSNYQQPSATPVDSWTTVDIPTVSTNANDGWGNSWGTD